MIILIIYNIIIFLKKNKKNKKEQKEQTINKMNLKYNNNILCIYGKLLL